MAKTKLSKLVGKQLSRLKYTYPYVSLTINVINMISLLILAFALPQVSFFYLIPVSVGLAFLIGFVFDKWGIFTQEWKQTVDINYRELNIENIKSQQFEILKFKALAKALVPPEKYETFLHELDKNYQKYLQDWNWTD